MTHFADVRPGSTELRLTAERILAVAIVGIACLAIAACKSPTERVIAASSLVTPAKADDNIAEVIKAMADPKADSVTYQHGVVALASLAVESDLRKRNVDLYEIVSTILVRGTELREFQFNDLLIDWKTIRPISAVAVSPQAAAR